MHSLTGLPAGYRRTFKWCELAVIVNCYGKQGDRIGSKGDFVMTVLLTFSHLLWIDQVVIMGLLWILSFVKDNLPLKDLGKCVGNNCEKTFLKTNSELAQIPANLSYRNCQVEWPWLHSSLFKQLSHHICYPHYQGTLSQLLFFLKSRNKLNDRWEKLKIIIIIIRFFKREKNCLSVAKLP